MKKTAVITGVTGQDGFYLSQFLLRKGYKVAGLLPLNRQHNLNKLGSLVERIQICTINLQNPDDLLGVIDTLRPTEIYNLAAPSFVPASWDDPLGTLDLVTGTATRLLKSVRDLKLASRFYQASSSEMFGNVTESPQDENTPFRPRNPYGAAKLHAHWSMSHHRERYDLFACSGILYNHESPLRPPQFVTRKVTLAAASIKLGFSDYLKVGNLDAKRDWGFAGDYVDAMWRMLQSDSPEDYVIGTGQLRTVRELVSLAFGAVDLDWEKYVVVEESLFRPDEHFQLAANTHKAKVNLNWTPQVTFNQMIETMVLTDLKRLKNGEINHWDGLQH